MRFILRANVRDQMVTGFVGKWGMWFVGWTRMPMMTKDASYDRTITMATRYAKAYAAREQNPNDPECQREFSEALKAVRQHAEMVAGVPRILERKEARTQ